MHLRKQAAMPNGCCRPQPPQSSEDGGCELSCGGEADLKRDTWDEQDGDEQEGESPQPGGLDPSNS